jgi:16S rRNA (cytosine1402-N4)-methyltransferase
MTAPGEHIPVLMDAVLRTLSPQPGDTVLDCTAGLGGHAAAMAERIGPTGTLVLLDVDQGNLARAKARILAMAQPPNVIAIHSPFSAAARLAQEHALVVDVLLADLGFSSNQISDAARGFSFQREGPLDMRLDPTSPVSASELVNTLPERELAKIIFDYGEDPAARRIAGAIVRARSSAPITTTAQLAAAVHSVAGRPGGRSPIDPATKTFQALRIAVNDELGHLDALLSSIRRGAEIGRTTWLRNDPGRGARVGIISFHSLEDRPVKQVFAAIVGTGRAAAVERGAIQADDAETAQNPRSRSAKLRVIRLGTADSGDVQ